VVAVVAGAGPLLLSLLPVPVELQPPSAMVIPSRPANSTLCSLRFMINSFVWVFFRCA
jgi:hypothetical protein